MSELTVLNFDSEDGAMAVYQEKLYEAFGFAQIPA